MRRLNFPPRTRTHYKRRTPILSSKLSVFRELIGAKSRLFITFALLVLYASQRENVYRFIPRQVKELKRWRVDWHAAFEKAHTSKKYNDSCGELHLHIISLKRSASRLVSTLASAQSQGLSVTVHTAVDGLDPFNHSDIIRYSGKKRLKKLSQLTNSNRATLESLYSSHRKRQLPERIRSILHERLRFGCYLSHVRLWEKLLSNDWPFMIILEDDVTLTPNFAEKFRLALKEAPFDWGLIYLNGCFQVFGPQIENNLLLSRGGLCTFGYAISRAGADYFMKGDQLRSDKPIDHMMDEEVSLGRLSAFHTAQVLVSTTSELSTLAYQM